MAGDIDRLKVRRLQLAGELAQLELTLKALDRSISIAYKMVDCRAAGKVFRHTQEYGRRGALTEYVLSLLESAPKGLTLQEVTDRAAQHFGLVFYSKAERRRFSLKTVHSMLRRLCAQGRVENAPMEGSRVKLWRLKSHLPTVEQLIVLAGSTNARSNNANGHPT
ncbi:hypothetical protein [Noviherbaspirillum sp. UKPF54]|uniref:hypothetical protein n=1 Tax=Noviherbaspirillum sp. UKPF54 TaxID=2601898 RepID=UPI0011B1B12D|nr:hypothetical protein [Noviherbaspirillum sp. UKPF54]QDZ28712.1 hypothetical protein FAY22_12575 [Noviherbaspirillum sp. UKPF54]